MRTNKVGLRALCPYIGTRLVHLLVLRLGRFDSRCRQPGMKSNALRGSFTNANRMVQGGIAAMCTWQAGRTCTGSKSNPSPTRW